MFKNEYTSLYSKINSCDSEYCQSLIIPPVYVTVTPSLFQNMRPHLMPVYKSYEKDEYCKFR